MNQVKRRKKIDAILEVRGDLLCELTLMGLKRE